MARPATKRIKFGTSEKARRKTNHFINAILRAFDGIIAHAPHGYGVPFTAPICTGDNVMTQLHDEVIQVGGPLALHNCKANL